MINLGPVIATASAATTAEALRGAMDATASGADRVELRIDTLDMGADVRSLLYHLRDQPLLVSGARHGVAVGEVPIFKLAQEMGALVDIPYGENLPGDLWGMDRSRLMLSLHDFSKTPDDLARKLGSMRALRAGFYKVVPTAKGPGDLLEVKRLLAKEGACGDLCAFSMGAPGVASRAMCLAWGSAATYASAPGCSGAAPGQIGLKELLEIYRPRTARYDEPLFGVVGWPLLNTGSPSLHNRWFYASGLPGRMVPLPAEGLEELLSACEGLSIRGLAVTIPHKEKVLRHLGGMSRLCRLVKACNTILKTDAGWYGCNTDIYGIRSALKGVPKGINVLLLGAGGVARSAAHVLSRCNRLWISSRRLSASRDLAKEFGSMPVHWERRHDIDADLIVNATPVGQTGDESPYPPECLRCRFVFDMVVRDGDTPLLRAAKKKGIVTIPGAKMLEAQARLQFKIFTGQRAPR